MKGYRIQVTIAQSDIGRLMQAASNNWLRSTDETITDNENVTFTVTLVGASPCIDAFILAWVPADKASQERLLASRQLVTRRW